MNAKLINPTFGAGGALDATAADYMTPYYLAGVDDQGSFTGGTTANGTATDRPGTEWLQLQPVAKLANGTPSGDANGGVLYTVTWATPTSGSDFYVDVIAYDKAAYPNFPGSVYAGGQSNWRIYDNVGGFSTNQSIGSNDILDCQRLCAGTEIRRLDLWRAQFQLEPGAETVRHGVLPHGCGRSISCRTASMQASRDVGSRCKRRLPARRRQPAQVRLRSLLQSFSLSEKKRTTVSVNGNFQFRNNNALPRCWQLNGLGAAVLS